MHKEMLNENEAAYYAGVSLSQFRKKAKEYGILPVPFMGKRIYLASDILRAYEKVRDSIVKHYPLNDRVKGARKSQ